MYTVSAILVGLGSGILSGVFGVGGGLIMTPLLLLILDTPALQAVATPMLVILPTTITGTIFHLRKKNVELRIAITTGLAGAAMAYVGAISATKVGGTVVIVATAIVLTLSALEVFRKAAQTNPVDKATGEQLSEEIEEGIAPKGATVPTPPGDDALHRPNIFALIVAGMLAGFGSGFLGVGGGFLLVPIYVSIFGLSMKRAAGTSLLAISIISIPGLISHIALGNVDIKLGLILAIGAIPGALIGSKIGLGSNERTLRIGFGVLMVITGIILALTELGII